MRCQGDDRRKNQVSKNSERHRWDRGPQQLYDRQEIQNGIHRQPVKNDGEKLVWLHIRPPRGVPSFDVTPRPPKMVTLQVGGPDLSIPSASFRAQALPLFVFEMCIRVCQDFTTWVRQGKLRPSHLQIQSGTAWSVYRALRRRFCGGSRIQRIVYKDPRGNHRPAISRNGLDKSFGQGLMGTFSEIRISRPSHRLNIGPSHHPRFEIEDLLVSHRQDSFRKGGHPQDARSFGGKNCFDYESLCPSSGVFTHNFRLDSQPSGWGGRVVVASAAFRRSQGGFEMAQEASKEPKRQVRVETLSSNSVSRRRVHVSRLGLDMPRREFSERSPRVLDPRPKAGRYSHSRVDEHSVWDQILQEDFVRSQRSDSDGQHDFVPHRAQRIFDSSHSKPNQINLRRAGSARRDAYGHYMDSNSPEYDTGPTLSLGGRERLVRKATNVGPDRPPLDRPSSRSLRKFSQRSTASLQLPLGTSTVGKFKRARPRLDEDLFVRVPAHGNASNSGVPDRSSRSARSTNRSTLGTSAMVANAPKHGKKLGVLGHRGRSLSTRSLQSMRPLEKSKVDILRSRSPRQWSTLKLELIDQALEPATKNTYLSQRRSYERFCNTQGLKPWPANMETIENFVTMLIYQNKPGAATNVWSAIVHYQRLMQYPELRVSPVLSKLLRKAKKNMALSASKFRDPIPMQLVRQYCEKHEHTRSESIQFNITLMLVGIRALLRGGELAKLTWGHIEFKENMLVIDLKVRKPRTEKAQPIWIDRSANTATCPVRALEKWKAFMRQKQCAHKNDYVFTSKFGKALTPAIIKQSIHEVVGQVNFKHGTYKGHSLRVTGAVAMMKAGRSAVEIQLLGNWKSEIFLRYLRTFILAADGLTMQMGF